MKLPKSIVRSVSRANPGQTLAEYVMIVAAVAIVVFVGYQHLSTIAIVNGLVKQISEWLTGS